MILYEFFRHFSYSWYNDTSIFCPNFMPGQVQMVSFVGLRSNLEATWTVVQKPFIPYIIKMSERTLSPDCISISDDEEEIDDTDGQSESLGGSED